MTSLQRSSVLALLDKKGPIAAKFPFFEKRPEQESMLSDILQAYHERQIALIEAGTGCGKSMAYLIPALLFAAVQKERTVISTHTIHLQEQLLHKDIPLLKEALGLSLKAVIVKGMGNYLCLRKLHDAMEERLLYSEEERREIEGIASTADRLKEGSRHELKVVPSAATWERVSAEHDTCTGSECPYYQQCYFFQARKQAQEAQILVVNHHLLFADLSIRADLNENQASILPFYSRLIIDEAHHIEDIATDYFGKRVSRLQLLKTLSRLATDKGSGKLPLLKEKLSKHFVKGFSSEEESLIDRLMIELPMQKKELLIALKETFDALSQFLAALLELDEEMKLRLREAHATHPFWKETVLPRMRELIGTILKLDQSLKSLEDDIEGLKSAPINEATQGVRHEIRALSNRLSQSAMTLNTLIEPTIPENQVRWIEHQAWAHQTNTSLVDANLDLSKLFALQLFSKFHTVILTSATLTSAKKFDYFKGRFGLYDEALAARVIEKMYPSPFNYKEQALLAIPSDLVSPLHDDFLDHAAKCILDVLEASNGAAFILFTSYQTLKACHALLAKALDERKYPVFKQGDKPRNLLLQQFATTARAVLFGTDSFWEGVDVAGEALRSVIIVKLPFKVPSEPIIQARTELLAKEGKDPFLEYSLPQAIVKFKQGFGRLIRSKKDRGAVVILDTRLLNKAYGKLFLASLPPCTEALVPKNQLKDTLKAFFKKKTSAL